MGIKALSREPVAKNPAVLAILWIKEIEGIVSKDTAMLRDYLDRMVILIDLAGLPASCKLIDRKVKVTAYRENSLFLYEYWGEDFFHFSSAVSLV